MNRLKLAILVFLCGSGLCVASCQEVQPREVKSILQTDFVKKLDQRVSQDVTPETNAMVEIARVVPISRLNEPEIAKRVCRILGVDPDDATSRLRFLQLEVVHAYDLVDNPRLTEDEMTTHPQEKISTIALFNLTTDCEEHLIACNKLTVEQIADYVDFMQAHPYLLDMADRIETATRFAAMAMIQNTILNGPAAAFADAGESQSEYMKNLFGDFHWNEDSVAAVCNRLDREIHDLIPLKYRKSRNGFLLYSPGMDGIDDGGRKYDEVADEESSDIRVWFGDAPEYAPGSHKDGMSR